MFLLTGAPAGKFYNEEAVSAQEMIKLFPEIKAFLADNAVVFDPLPKTIKTKKGVTVYRLAMQTATMFTGTYKGQSITIRYYKTRTGSKDKARYAPTHVPFMGKRREIILQDRDLDLAVFFLLHPCHSLSPMAKKTAEAYMAINQAEIDRKGVENANMVARLLSAIQSDYQKNPFGLMVKAYGIKIQNKYILPMTKHEIGRAFVALNRAAMENPEKFSVDYSDTRTSGDGLVRYALAVRALRIKAVGGRRSVVWNDGTPFVNIPTSENEASWMAAYVARNIEDLYDVFKHKILGSNGIATETEVEQPDTFENPETEHPDFDETDDDLPMKKMGRPRKANA